MRILVTGGAGFIGSNFVNYWIVRHPQDQIIVLDKLTYPETLISLAKVKNHPQFTFVHGNIIDYQLVCELTKDVDLIVHFAAESHVDISLSGLEVEKNFYRTNVEGTITLLHAARLNGVSRFHHVSTDEVFGDLDYDSPEKFHENFPYNPHSPYAISKAAADFAVKGFFRSYGLPVTISNCTNNYGPFQIPEKLIPRSIALLSEDKKVKLYSDASGNPGRNVRDWIHVEDHCRGIESIITNGKIGESYCMGGHCELSNYELVKRILDIMSSITCKDLKVETHVALVKDRPGHDHRYAMNTSKIESELNWKPEHSFETGFRSIVEWYISDEGQTWLNSLKRTTRDIF